MLGAGCHCEERSNLKNLKKIATLRSVSLHSFAMTVRFSVFIQLYNIFANHVKFQIYHTPDFKFFKIGMF